MLKHVIIKHKPKITFDNIKSWIAEGRSPHTVKPMFTRQIKNQNELNDMLNKYDLDYSEGDYVTYNATRSLGDIFQIYYVRKFLVDYSKIFYWTATGAPEITQIIGVWGFLPSCQYPPKWEWRTGWGLRKLTEEEITKFINDQVRNHIQLRLQERAELELQQQSAC
jgi:hypothetical protein